jgi:toxin CptA
MSTGLFAAFLALIAGFSAQRGSICSVVAVGELIRSGDARRFTAFFECSMWSLIVLSMFGGNIAGGLSDYPLGAAAALGGALFGAGAALNGACAFGSAARLGRGELAFVGTPTGFFIGAFAISHFTAAPAASSAPASIGGGPFVLALVAGFVLIQIVRLVTSDAAPRNAFTALMKPAWSPSLAMAAIGLVNGVLLILFKPWPYSSLLVDLGAKGHADGAFMKSLLALAFVLGAGIGARTAGRFRIEAPRLGELSAKTFAGFFMGAGAFLVPGGNDSLVLYGLPLLLPYAMLAYAAMIAAIAIIVVAGERFGRG